MCWGSFLNVVGYRIIRGKSFITPRSRCPHCNHAIAWYDNIPVISWLLLNGHCRSCKKPISILYPFIELVTAIVMSLLYLNVDHHYFFGYFFFFSALIVTIRSDLETMLISRWATLFLIPISLWLCYAGLLPLTLHTGIIGTCFGYLTLTVLRTTFFMFTGKEGLGQGDLDLLAFIGSCTGIIGCWVALLIGSIAGSCYGIGYSRITGNKHSLKIPFGPFLALSAIAYVLWQPIFIFLLLRHTI